MHYKETAQAGHSYQHLWDVASEKAYDGGFLLDTSSFPTGTKVVPKGILVKCDLSERTAVPVKTVVLAAALTTAGTALKIEKGHNLIATDKIGTSTASVTVGTIDTSDEDYDEITIEANALGALSKGDVLQSHDASGAIVPNGLIHRDVEIDDETLCSVIFRADGIVISRLPQPISSDIEDALKDCQFLNI